MSLAEKIYEVLEPGTSMDVDEIHKAIGASRQGVYLATMVLYKEGAIMRTEKPRQPGEVGRKRHLFFRPSTIGLPDLDAERLTQVLSRGPERKDRDDRYRRMLALYDGGATLEEIGAKEGMTRERVRQILTGPEYKAIKARRSAEAMARDEERRTATRYDKTCPTCGREFRGTAAGVYCRKRCHEIRNMLRFVTSDAEHEKHREQMAHQNLKLPRTDARRRHAERFLATLAAGETPPEPRGRWFVEGSQNHVVANHAMVHGWPIFGRIRPELQQWLRDHPIAVPTEGGLE